MYQFTSKGKKKKGSVQNESSLNEDSYYVRVKASRKVYLPLYLMALVVFVSLIYVYFSGEGLQGLSLILGGVFVFFSVKYPEVHRMMNVYEIDKHYLIHTNGIVNKTTKKIFLPTISDLILKQNPWQAFLGYGTVKVHRFSDGSAIDLRNVPNPKKIIDVLGKKINNELDN